MRASAVSFTHKLIAAALAALLTFALVPLAHADGESSNDDNSGVVASALADLSNDSADSPLGELQEVSDGQDAEGSPVAPMLASGLAGKPSSFINSDVALDSEPVIGSFTVDGLTFAVIDGPYVELVGVAPRWQQVTNSQEGEGSGVAPMLASGSDGDESDAVTLTLPETVAYEGVSHIVSSIGAYAFYLSGTTDVMLPASVSNVDDRAFRSSDVASVDVAGSNPFYSSFDGALYDAERLSLLLIPEGKQGTVRIPKTAEVVEASVFSHCPLVESISVDAGSAAFASENGLLYTSDLTTLLRVPTGATEVAIREGCTTIAAGTLEACANLTTINAPASVTSISPDIFHAIPTVSLPAASVSGSSQQVTDSQDASDSRVAPMLASGQADGEAEVSPRRVIASSQGLEALLALPDLGSTSASPSAEASGSAPQLTAMVALSTTDDDLPEVDPSSIEVVLPEGVDGSCWESLFGTVLADVPTADLQVGSVSRAKSAPNGKVTIYTGGGVFSWLNGRADPYASLDPTASSHATQCYTPNWALQGNAEVGGVFGYYNGQENMPPYSIVVTRDGYTFAGWTGTYQGIAFIWYVGEYASDRHGDSTATALWTVNSYEVAFDTQAGETISPISAIYDRDLTLPAPAERAGYRFLGWNTEVGGSGTTYQPGTARNLTTTNGATVMLYAQWERMDYNIGFDVDSEPGDVDYPGEPKEDQSANVESGTIAIEDPKRPGYVFEGWVIPNAEGTEARDQDLVYQGEDGKWYVDASKLPDYAGDDGRVELTARWTSVISVDVPSSVTFYADVVTQGNESREGLASSAFGQNKVQSQSEVDLRIVGLESKQVKGNGSTSLGASDILKKKDGGTVSDTADKLFSLYPATGELTEDALKDPDRTSAKPEGAVDFSLDDVLLEKSFAADEFTIPAGDTLSLGYRLNLQETSTELNYDKLSTLDEGTSVSIASISYCFAADYGPVFWTADDDGSTLELASIKADAEKIAAGDTATISKYTRWMNADHRFYVKWYDQGVAEADNPTKATVYDVRIIGLNHDDKSDGSGKAGITFQFVNGLDDVYPMSASKTNAGGWGASDMIETLNAGRVWSQSAAAFKQALVEVDKEYYAGPASLFATLKSAPSYCFLLSFTEISAKGFPSGWSKLSDEGGIYDWWRLRGIDAQAENSAAKKGFQRAPDEACSWWLRSAYPTLRKNYAYVNTIGWTCDGSNYDASLQLLVSPCFCM